MARAVRSAAFVYRSGSLGGWLVLLNLIMVITPRFPFAPMPQVLPRMTGVIGAAGVVAPLRMMNGQMGDIGLFTFQVFPGRRPSTMDMVAWFERHLAPQLGRFPGPRSVVVLDNAPSHR